GRARGGGRRADEPAHRAPARGSRGRGCPRSRVDARPPARERKDKLCLYGYAPARCLLRRRRAAKLLAGGGAARSDAAGGQPADPVAREAPRAPAARSLRPSGRADRGGSAAVPKRAAAARAGGAAARRAGRGGGGGARGPARDRRFHRARRDSASRRPGRVPAAASGRARRAVGVGHAARDRAGRAPRARARRRRRAATAPRRRLRAVLPRRGRARRPARASLRRPEGDDRRAAGRADRAHAGGSRRAAGDRGRAARARCAPARPRRAARARPAGVGAERGPCGLRHHVHLPRCHRRRCRRWCPRARARRGPRPGARDLARTGERPHGDARRAGIRRLCPRTARVMVRWGPLLLLAEVCDELGVREPLLVASPRWDKLELPILPSARWSEVPSARVDEAAHLARDGVVAIGGGSAIDLGKAISATARVPLVSVPTTYAGAEWTPYFGVRDPERRMRGGGSGAQLAAIVYDVGLTVGLPREETVGTSMNALAHCAEALYVHGHNPESDEKALEGARLISR